MSSTNWYLVDVKWTGETPDISLHLPVYNSRHTTNNTINTKLDCWIKRVARRIYMFTTLEHSLSYTPKFGFVVPTGGVRLQILLLFCLLLLCRLPVYPPIQTHPATPVLALVLSSVRCLFCSSCTLLHRLPHRTSVVLGIVLRTYLHSMFSCLVTEAYSNWIARF